MARFRFADRARTAGRSWVLTVLFGSLVGGSIACFETRLDVGDPIREIDAGLDASPNPSLLATATERCGSAHGVRDPFASAADLDRRLLGRWYSCTPAESSPLEGATVGIELLASGEYFLLVSDEEGSFARSTLPDEHGTFRYFAFVDADAGTSDGGDGGPSGGFVSRDDDLARRPIVIYLDRANAPSVVVVPEFELAPRRLFLTGQGPEGLEAELVDITDLPSLR